MIGDKKFYNNFGNNLNGNNLNGYHYSDDMIDENMIQTPSNLTANSGLLMDDGDNGSNRASDTDNSHNNVKQRKVWDDRNAPWPEQWRLSQFE